MCGQSPVSRSLNSASRHASSTKIRLSRLSTLHSLQPTPCLAQIGKAMCLSLSEGLSAFNLWSHWLDLLRKNLRKMVFSITFLIVWRLCFAITCFHSSHNIMLVNGVLKNTLQNKMTLLSRNTGLSSMPSTVGTLN